VLACGGEEAAAPDPGGAAAQADSGPGDNRPPQVERLRLEPAEPLPGGRVRAVANVRDPDGDRVTQSFRWEVDGEALDVDEAEIDLEPARKGDRVEVWVTASDGQAESEPANASTSVGNRRPVLENVALQPAGTVLPGQPAVATPVAGDPDGDALEFRFRWTVNDATAQGQEGSSFPTDGLEPGDRIRVEVIASDGEGESDAAWSGALTVGNAAPEIRSRPAGVAAGAPFRYAVDARDPEGDKSLRYELRKGPDGMSINPILGEVQWQPRADQAGVHPVEIAVADSRGATTVQTFELTVGQPAAAPQPAAASEE
jgi:hypothetical protein